MRKILKLINDEKKKLVVPTVKGCTTDYDADNIVCSQEDDNHCETGADYCYVLDHATCTTGAVDDCRYIDSSACHEKHFDLCSNEDNSYCSEAEKYDLEG